MSSVSPTGRVVITTRKDGGRIRPSSTIHPTISARVLRRNWRIFTTAILRWDAHREEQALSRSYIYMQLVSPRAAGHILRLLQLGHQTKRRGKLVVTVNGVISPNVNVGTVGSKPTQEVVAVQVPIACFAAVTETISCAIPVSAWLDDDEAETRQDFFIPAFLEVYKNADADAFVIHEFASTDLRDRCSSVVPSHTTNIGEVFIAMYKNAAALITKATEVTQAKIALLKQGKVKGRRRAGPKVLAMKVDKVSRALEADVSSLLLKTRGLGMNLCHISYFCTPSAKEAQEVQKMANGLPAGLTSGGLDTQEIIKLATMDAFISTVMNSTTVTLGRMRKSGVL